MNGGRSSPDPTNSLNRFAKDLSREDFLGVILRGHLHIEAMLNAKIRARLRYPAAIQLDGDKGLGFAKKIELAVAIGIVPNDLAPVFKRLNKYRNHLAHNLSFQPGLNEARDFQRLFPPKVGSFYEYMKAKLPNVGDEALRIFRCSIIVLYLKLVVDLPEALRLERENSRVRVPGQLNSARH